MAVPIILNRIILATHLMAAVTRLSNDLIIKAGRVTVTIPPASIIFMITTVRVGRPITAGRRLLSLATITIPIAS